AVFARTEHPLLILERQPPKQREDLSVCQAWVSRHPRLQYFGGVSDFALARKEDQHVAGFFAAEFIDGVRDRVERVAGFFHIVRVIIWVLRQSLLLEGPIPDLYRICAARDLDDRGGCTLTVLEVLGKRFRIDGGGSNDDLEIVTFRQQSREVAQEKIDIEAALVGLVNNDDRVFRQVGIVLNLS